MASESIIHIINEGQKDKQLVIRAAGDENVLVECGANQVELAYRVRIYWLENLIHMMKVKGVVDLTPGVRSLLITYRSQDLPVSRLLKIIEFADLSINRYMNEEIPSRIVKMPIAFDDLKTKEYIEKYIHSVRETAPYLPSNIEFVAKCNGLSGATQVKEYFLATEHLVMGLGDVYLGAPCAIPLDPRYRLNAPKYNPARTMTPEGAVGIGGSFVCIYPMVSPGGYQLIGRTIPFFDTWQVNDSFSQAPWLLRPFDQIKFYEVDEPTLDLLTIDLKNNQYHFETSESSFNLNSYTQFCRTMEDAAKAFNQQQKEAIVEATKGY